MLIVGNTRPYPPTGLTTALWAGVDVSWVAFATLITTQDGVELAGLLGQSRSSSDPHPHVVSWRGKHYLEDGHCRAARAALAGATGMLMRVYSVE